jgi:hypothetical protein
VISCFVTIDVQNVLSTSAKNVRWFFFWEFFRGLEAYECDPTAMVKVGKGIQILPGKVDKERTTKD